MSDLVKSPRPRVLGGITVKVVTSCGNMYVQMNWCSGKLFEVFATLGHSGSCASCETEALTRSVTLGLRSGIPCSEYAKELKGIQCPSPMLWPKDARLLSCPDAIGKVIAEFGELSPKQLISILRGSRTSIGSDEETLVKIEMKRLAAERERLGLND